MKLTFNQIKYPLYGVITRVYKYSLKLLYKD